MTMKKFKAFKNYMIQAMEELEMHKSQESDLMFRETGLDEVHGNLEPVAEPTEGEHSEGSSTSATGAGWLVFLSLDYYQSFFDVTTMQVMERILSGMVPRFGGSLVDKLSPSPDLYGPFWLAMTLTLTVALSSNLSRLLHDMEKWEFHFYEVTLLGSVIYAYLFFTPFVLWCVLWWRGNRDRYTLLQLIAIYGYSISIFIPLMFLWLINSELVRWLLLAVAILSSGWVLCESLWRPLRTESIKVAVCLLLVVSLPHAGLFIGFKFLYFSAVHHPTLQTSSLHSNLTVH